MEHDHSTRTTVGRSCHRATARLTQISTRLRLGYFGRDDPIIAFGFGAILFQGALLSVIYPFLCRGKTVLAGAATLALVMGGYHWTAHVLAEAAKHPIEPLTTWFAKEFDITGRSMKGWIMVEPDGFTDDADLSEWVKQALGFVKTLPAK